MSVDNPLDKRRKAGSDAPAGRGSRGAARGIDAAEAHERIWGAIMDHSLPPETRLVEGELCKIFGLGRTRGGRDELRAGTHQRILHPLRKDLVRVPRSC